MYKRQDTIKETLMDTSKNGFGFSRQEADHVMKEIQNMDAVSYTHLFFFSTLYLYCFSQPSFCAALNSVAVNPFSSPFFIQRYSFSVLYCHVPVSYTHLDVYKRQAYKRLKNRADTNSVVDVLKNKSKGDLIVRKIIYRCV